MFGEGQMGGMGQKEVAEDRYLGTVVGVLQWGGVQGYPKKHLCDKVHLDTERSPCLGEVPVRRGLTSVSAATSWCLWDGLR